MIGFVFLFCLLFRRGVLHRVLLVVGNAGSCIQVVFFVWVLTIWYSLRLVLWLSRVLESVLLLQKLWAWFLVRNKDSTSGLLWDCCCCCQVTSVVSDTVWPHRRQPTRFPHPWDSPGKSTGVGCHFLLQWRKVKSESEVAQLCPTLCDPMDCSLPGSSIHRIF